jgi:hypothetical protein
MTPARFVALLLLIGALCSAVLSAQRRRFSGFGFTQNETPTTEFAIARWYSSGWTSDGWSHDYPTAEQHILQILKETSLLDTERFSYQIVDLASRTSSSIRLATSLIPAKSFLRTKRSSISANTSNAVDFSCLMISEGRDKAPGKMDGFLNLLRRAFPGRDMYPLLDDHELLRISYDVDDLNMVHPMSGAKSTFYGFNDSKGRLAMVICYANDVGDYWEFIDQRYYPVKPSAEALKLGMNIVLYSMTH